jgi:hypothetical protein
MGIHPSGGFHYAGGFRIEYSANARGCLRPDIFGADRLRHAGRNCEPDGKWSPDHGARRSGRGSGSQSGNSRLFHPPHVAAEGTDGRISVAHGNGLAKGENCYRGKALVPTGLAWVPTDSGDESATKRSDLRQDHHSAFEGTPWTSRCGIVASVRSRSSASQWKSALNPARDMAPISATFLL